VKPWKLPEQKDIDNDRVEFVQGDTYNLKEVAGDFNAGCANPIYNHI